MNEFLASFGVSSHKELLEFIRDNPTDEKVIELKELLHSLGIAISFGAGEKNE